MLKKNFIYQLIYEIFVFIIPFITSPYLARVLGAELIGEFSYGFSIAYYFYLFSMLGILNYGNREIAQNKSNPKLLSQVFSELFVIHGSISILFIILYFIYIFFIAENKVIALALSIYVVGAFFDISWFYFGIEKFKITIARDVFLKLTTTVLLFIFVHSQNDLWIYCVIYSAGALASKLLLWVPIKKYTYFTMPQITNLKKHIKPLIILFIPALAISLYKYMDKIMLGLMSNKAQLGYYENSEKAINIPMSIINAFGTVMLPRVSNMVAEGSNEKIKKYFSLSMKCIGWLGFGLAFGLGSVATHFAQIFWGDKFIPSGELICGLSITIPFIAVANIIRTQLLIPNRRDKEYVISILVGAIINLFVNWMLIPHYGALGAVTATILVEMIVCIIQVLFVRKEVNFKEYWGLYLLYILTGSVMFASIYCIGKQLTDSILSLIIKVLVGLIIYVVLSFIILIVKKDEEMLVIFQKVKRKKKI